MEMPREVLEGDREPTPAWLAGYRPGAGEISAAIMSFLGSRIAFYPGSGIVDGESLETFAASHSAHCVLHVDLMNPASLVADALSKKFRPYIHIAGYRAVDLKVWNAAETAACLKLKMEHPYDQDPALQGACWAVLEREPRLTDAHGPKRIAFLHVQCEAVWLYWNLFVRRRRAAPFSILIHDHGWGGNWTTFGPGGVLHELAVSSDRLPRWLLAEDRFAWPGYRPVSAPTPSREFRLPPELNMGEWDWRGGRRLHARGQGPSDGADLPEPLSTIPKDLPVAGSSESSPVASRGFSVPMNPVMVLSRKPRRLAFAYGSNMDPDQFRERCPGSEVVGIAVLHDFHWCITDRGVASVRSHPGGRVFGVLLRLTAKDETRLDVCEGVHAGFYLRRILPVEMASGGSVDALVYIAEDVGYGKPRPGYLERVLAGARHHGLPDGAIAEIASWGQSTPDPSACTVPVFVYGTLKRGHCNHVYIADGVYVGDAETVDRFALHVHGLPRVDRHNPVSPIHGELYRVTANMLAEIDRLEGHPHCYRRGLVPVRLVDGTVAPAWLYFHPAPDGPIESSGRFENRSAQSGPRKQSKAVAGASDESGA